MLENRNDDVDMELEDENEGTPLDADVVEVEENLESRIKKIKEQLKESEKEKKQHLDDLQRAKADFLNTRKRLEAEKLAIREQMISVNVETLLPLCDSFNMAMANAEAWSAIDTTWRVGVESIFAQLQSILKDYGVSEINPVGETFDPNKHDAMTNVTVDSEEEENKIISVIQLGYVRKIEETEVLIRPARVTVGVLENN